MKSSLFLFLLLLISTVTCSIPGEKDYSYQSDRYLELGIPDYSRPWKINELGDVLGTLRDIKNNDPRTLPRNGSRKSGELFDHFVGMDNLSFLNIDTVPLYEKAYRIQSFVRLQQEYVDIYSHLHLGKEYYNKELVEIYIYGILLTEKMLDLAYQINASDHPDDVHLQSGFEGIQFGHVFMLQSVLDKQKNTSHYQSEDLERLSETIAQSVRKNRSWFDTIAIDKIRQNMLVVIDSSSSQKIRKKYLNIINTL